MNTGKAASDAEPVPGTENSVLSSLKIPRVRSGGEGYDRIPLPAPTEQADQANAGGEERQGAGKRCRAGIDVTGSQIWVIRQSLVLSPLIAVSSATFGSRQ